MDAYERDWRDGKADGKGKDTWAYGDVYALLHQKPRIKTLRHSDVRSMTVMLCATLTYTFLIMKSPIMVNLSLDKL